MKPAVIALTIFTAATDAAAQDRIQSVSEAAVALRVAADAQLRPPDLGRGTKDESAAWERTQTIAGPRVPHVAISSAMWAAGFFVLSATARASCGTGCEADGGALLVVLPAAGGAGVGALVGLLSRADARRAGASAGSRFGSPSGRIGLAYNQLVFTSSEIASGAAGSTLAIAVQLSPRITTHVEISTSDRTFSAAPGAVPQEVLDNVIPAASRAASFPAGIDRRRVSFAFAQLAGVEIGRWDRVRVEALGGLAVHAVETRDYYPAFGAEGPIEGKYYVLDFESPESGLVAGVDAEIAIGAGFSIVPTLRYQAFGDPGGSFTYGVGAHWRIGRR